MPRAFHVIASVRALGCRTGYPSLGGGSYGTSAAVRRRHLRLTPQQRIEKLMSFMRSLERLRDAARDTR
jgi:hypothetical protein